jgi:soluble lytic murein transglycosylase-like protein
VSAATSLAAAAALLATASATAGESIYLSRSAAGTAIYSNVAPYVNATPLMQLSAARPAVGPRRARLGGDADRADAIVHELVRQASARHGIDVELLLALIRHESNFDALAVSRAGARGLMQLMPGTAARYGVRRVHDPGENIAGGSAYLRDLLDLFGRIDLALAAYNAGEGAVMRYGNRVPPFPETQAYVRNVIADYERRRATR